MLASCDVVAVSFPVFVWMDLPLLKQSFPCRQENDETVDQQGNPLAGLFNLEREFEVYKFKLCRAVIFVTVYIRSIRRLRRIAVMYDH